MIFAGSAITNNDYDTFYSRAEAGTGSWYIIKSKYKIDCTNVALIDTFKKTDRYIIRKTHEQNRKVTTIKHGCNGKYCLFKLSSDMYSLFRFKIQNNQFYRFFVTCIYYIVFYYHYSKCLNVIAIGQKGLKETKGNLWRANDRVIISTP